MGIHKNNSGGSRKAGSAARRQFYRPPMLATGDGKVLDVDEYAKSRGRIIGSLLIFFFFIPIVRFAGGSAILFFHWDYWMPDDFFGIFACFSLAVAGVIVLVAAHLLRGYAGSVALVTAAVLPLILLYAAIPAEEEIFKAMQDKPMLIYASVLLVTCFTLVIAASRLREYFAMSLAVRLTGLFAGLGVLALFFIPGLFKPGTILALWVFDSLFKTAVLFPALLISLVALVSAWRWTPNTARRFGTVIIIMAILYTFALPWIMLPVVLSFHTQGTGSADIGTWITTLNTLLKGFGLLYTQMGLVAVAAIELVGRILHGRHAFKLARADTLKKVDAPGVARKPTAVIKKTREMDWLDNLRKGGMISKEEYEKRKKEIKDN